MVEQVATLAELDGPGAVYSITDVALVNEALDLKIEAQRGGQK